MSGKQQRTLIQPINAVFKYLQTGQRVQIWLYDITDFRLEGVIRGFDEYMNLTMEEAEEVWVKEKKNIDGSAAADQSASTTGRNRKQYGDRTPLGRLLLKGENVTLIQPAPKRPAGQPSGTIPTQAMEE